MRPNLSLNSSYFLLRINWISAWLKSLFNLSRISITWLNAGTWLTAANWSSYSWMCDRACYNNCVWVLEFAGSSSESTCLHVLFPVLIWFQIALYKCDLIYMDLFIKKNVLWSYEKRMLKNFQSKFSL